MGLSIFVTFELSPFTAGGIGRVIHNQIKCMDKKERQKTIIILVNQVIDQNLFASYFPDVQIVFVNEQTDLVCQKNYIHNPPRRAYSNTEWHWYSALVYRKLHEISLNNEIDYVEFPDYGALGFIAIQEKHLSGFLNTATLAVRLHSTSAILFKYEPYNTTSYHLNLIDLERKSLRDCDLIIGQLQPVAEATRKVLGFSEAEWAPRLYISAPPVLLDTREVQEKSILPSPTTPIVFGSKLQRFKRPDLFIRGVNTFFNTTENTKQDVFFSAHSFDESYRISILKLIQKEYVSHFHLDAPRTSNLREPLIANSIYVMPSDFESFCLSAYEASLLGAVVILNGQNSAFGENTPWVDGQNCIKFDGTPPGLSDALKRAYALENPLDVVQIPQSVMPWNKNKIYKEFNALEEFPLVSIIIPNYNLGKFLLETIQNLLCQNYCNIELIVVDDCSSERETKDIIKHLSSLNNSKIKVVQAVANIGLAAVRNLAISHASGRYILPLDADDLLHEDFINFSVTALENSSEYDVVVPQAGFFYAKQDIPFPGEDRDFPDYAVFIGEPLVNGVCENRYSTATCLIRAEIFTEFKYCESMTCYEDWNFYLRLAQAGKRFLVTTDVYFYYRSRPNSMVTADRNPEQKGIFKNDLLRNGLDMQALQPLGYLAFLSNSATQSDLLAVQQNILNTQALREEFDRNAQALRDELEYNRLKLNQVYSSNSWRLTKPLRKVINKIKG